MNSKKFFCTFALAGLGLSTLANAESYDGVLTVRSERLRTDLALEAREAALKPVVGEAAWIDKVQVPVGQLARADVRRQAASTARAGNLYGDHAGAGVLTLGGGAAMHDTVGSQAREVSRTPRGQGSGG